MIWDMLDTDMLRSSQYTYRCWVRTLRVHADERGRGAGFKGAYFTVQKALPFLNAPASIIFNGSVNALTGIADSSLYTANKGAIHALARALVAELIGHGIRVNTITIGPTATRLLARSGSSQAILDAQNEPVILVGYSMGGLAITAAAEEHPEKIKTQVYLTAYLVHHGESLAQVISWNTETLLGVHVNKAQGYFTVQEETLREAVFADCSDEDFERARLRLHPQPIAPLITPVKTTVERFGRIPKVYIECLTDRAIPPAFQKAMYTAMPFQKILSLCSGHSPFYSVPEELVTRLTMNIEE